MKNRIIIFAFACFAIMGFASCSTTPFEDNKVFSPLITQGTWEVNMFMESSNNQTPDFAGYTFVFDLNGSVKATKNGVDVNGTWIEDISKNILIVFDNTDPVLYRFTKEWLVKGYTKTSINLSSTDPLITDRVILQQK